jgi:Tol biopolymer transport system component
VDRRGGEKPLTELSRPFFGPRLSPDGTRVAVSIGPNDQQSDVWVYEAERRTLSRLTHDEKSGWPVWTADGRRLWFVSPVNNRYKIFCQNADGSAEAEPLLKSSVSQWPHSISPDGAWLAFSEFNLQTHGDMWLFPLQGLGQPKLLLATPYNEWGGFFSPDGRWLAYASDESGRFEIYVLAFPGPSGRWQISSDGGTEPMWSRDGREIFYRQGDKMMSVAIRNSAAFGAGAPRTLFEAKYVVGLPGLSNYCVTSDGDGFLMVKPVESGVPPIRLEVVLNWVEELKRLRSAAVRR